MANKATRPIGPVGLAGLDGPMSLGSSSSRVVTPKAARQVADVLRERILAGETPPGSYLPTTNDLIEEFGVSRPTLREALNNLEGDGLIQLRRGPNGGAVVKTPDSAAIIRQLGFLLRYQGTTIEQLMDVRLLVDPLAARLVVENGKPEDIEAIGQSIERQQKLKNNTTHEEWFRENLYFHWAIAAASNNPVVRVLSESLHNIALDGGLEVRVKRGERVMSIEEHEAVYDAIVEGDGEKAAEMIRRHLERSIYLRAHYLR